METTLQTAFESSITTMVADRLALLAYALPKALTLVGGMLPVGYGIKFFKKITGKA